MSFVYKKNSMYMVYVSNGGKTEDFSFLHVIFYRELTDIK